MTAEFFMNSTLELWSKIWFVFWHISTRAKTDDCGIIHEFWSKIWFVFWHIYIAGLELGIWNSGCQSLVNPKNFKGETQRYVVKLPKSAGAGQYFPKIPWVPDSTFQKFRGCQAPMAPILTQALLSIGLKFLPHLLWHWLRTFKNKLGDSAINVRRAQQFCFVWQDVEHTTWELGNCFHPSSLAWWPCSDCLPCAYSNGVICQKVGGERRRRN